MNGVLPDPQTKALEFVAQGCIFTLIVTIALLAWVASGVDFSNEIPRVGAMLWLTVSVVYGVASLALIPLVQEARKPGQSNFDVDARYWLFGRRSLRLKSVLMPQYLSLLLGIVFYIAGMID
jgi:4-hydroxybenzoate polyprenyltransferase